MVLAPVVRERKGEYGKLLEEMRQRGLRARGRRRRAAPARRGDRARQEVQARHLDRRRPPGDEGGRAQAPRGVGRGGLAARRRAGRGRDRSTGGRRARSPGGEARARGSSAGRAPASAARSLRLLARSSPASTAAPRCPSSSRGSSPSTRPHGACERCHGLGFQRVIDPELVVPDPTLSIAEGALRAVDEGGTRVYYRRLLEAVAEANGIDTDVALAATCRSADRELLPRRHRRRAPHGQLHATASAAGARYTVRFEGIAQRASSAATRRPTPRTPASGSRATWPMQPCPACDGARLRPESLAVEVGGLGIPEYTRALGARGRWSGSRRSS